MEIKQSSKLTVKNTPELREQGKWFEAHLVPPLRYWTWRRAIVAVTGKPLRRLDDPRQLDLFHAA